MVMIARFLFPAQHVFFAVLGFDVSLEKFRRVFLSLLVLIFFFLPLRYMHAETAAPVFTHSLLIEEFTPRHFPSSWFKQKIEEKIEKINPDIGSELVHHFSVPFELIEGLSDEELDLIVMQTLLAVRSQKGIEYYSNSRKQYREFILDIYRVASVSNTAPLPDKAIEKLEEEVSTRIYKKDSSFGKGIFSYDIHYRTSHEFLVSMVNLQNVFYKIFILIAQRKALNSDFIIQRKQNSFFIYGLSMSRADMPFKSIRRRAAYSLLYRMHAVTKWFETEITKRLRENKKN